MYTKRVKPRWAFDLTDDGQVPASLNHVVFPPVHFPTAQNEGQAYLHLNLKAARHFLILPACESKHGDPNLINMRSRRIRVH